MVTLADLTDVDVSVETDGVSFLPTLLSKQSKQQKHEYLFWDFAGYGGQLAVRMGSWKGIKRQIRKNPNAPLELYDLENDIQENNNVVADHSDIAEKIEAIMLQARTRPEVERFQFGEYAEDSSYPR